ncbi:MAG: methionyl-tRNA formyltransferase [Endomicrobia bacterium]|nr:methionyl-tRNA formyltransferase [Endomicrobiia bacterium]
MVKILYFGTASISEAFLKDLYENKHELFCITMPDKPASRGQKLTPPAVKSFAINNNIEYIQPEKFTPEVVEIIKSFNADAGVAVAYGKLIPGSVFSAPKYKTFNIHFSLLPKYRGAAPVQYAVLNGEAETGVTAFYLEKTLDTGDIIIQEKYPIDIKDTSETLFNKLIPLGIEVMNKALSCFETGNFKALPQYGEASYAPVIKKEDGLINWNDKVKNIYNKIRAFYPWPSGYSIVSKGKLEGKRIKIIEAEIIEGSTVNEDYGYVYSIEKHKGFSVLCAKGKLLITKIQPENKPVMDAGAFILGGQIEKGDCLN